MQHVLNERRRKMRRREEPGFKEVGPGRAVGLALSYNACSEGGGIG